MPEPRLYTGEVKISERPDEPSIYPTVAAIASSGEEIIVRFGERNLDNPATAIGIIKVYLSLPHAKRLATGLVQVIQNYEELFGEVAADPRKHLTAKGRERFHLDDAKPKD